MLLSNINDMKTYVVKSVFGDKNTARRLYNLGFERGAEITVVRALKGNKAVVVSLLGRAVILSFGAASFVEVDCV